MGNRSQTRQHIIAPVSAPIHPPIATLAPTPAPVIAAIESEAPVFVVSHQHIEQTTTIEVVDNSLPPIPEGMTKEELDEEDERALRIASGQEEGTPKREYDDRRGRRSPYRRRGPRRPSNVRREHNNEHAAEFSAPANDPTAH